ncbi:MAG: endolytic transglycosylase MltG [Candidatus Yonathbacteria bacterium]|nr:endolytic transglycosylase MltG [Candidatus Yonathbacteria bacterium]
MEQKFSSARMRDRIFLFFKDLWGDIRMRYALLALFFLIIFLWCAIRPSAEFPVRTIISIEEGIPLAQISHTLKEQGVIRSELLFEVSVILRGGEKRVQAGDYFFTEPLSSPTVASRLTRGEFGLAPVRVTILEGAMVADIAKLLKQSFWNFDDAVFLAHAQDKEGFLFPDTYFFLPNTSPDDAIKVMNENFNKKIKGVEEKIKNFGKSLHDVVIMASIIEKEAMTQEDRRIVSGILWKRIKIGMPLAVDAAFLYVNGETTKGLSTNDLKIDSPYNTYRYKGLPKGPIGNPGLDAIMAAIEPQVSPYLYYLSDKQGVMHYSKTFEEHKKNKGKYL